MMELQDLRSIWWFFFPKLEYQRSNLDTHEVVFGESLVLESKMSLESDIFDKQGLEGIGFQ